MSLLHGTIPRPRDWQDFERKLRVLAACVFQDDLAQLNGRSGQQQHGVDILVRRQGNPNDLIGLQCKRRAEVLSTAALEAAYEDARGYRPLLTELIVATTSPRDSSLQRKALELSAKSRDTDYPFLVTVWAWEDIEEQVARYAEAHKAFDPTYSPIAEAWHESTAAQLRSIDETLRQVGAAVGSEAAGPDPLPAYLLRSIENISRLLVSVAAVPAVGSAPAVSLNPSPPGRAPIVSLKTLFGDGRPLAVLSGESGCGKSTYLLQQAVQLCEEGLRNFSNDDNHGAIAVPIHADLTAYRGPLAPFLQQQATQLSGVPFDIEQAISWSAPQERYQSEG